MDKNDHIAQLITESLLGQLSEEGKAELDSWLKASTEHLRMYESMTKGGELGKELDRLETIDHKAALKAMEKRLSSNGLRGKQKPIFKTMKWLSAAAIFILVAGISIWFLRENKNNAEQPIAKVRTMQITHGTTQATVILDDGQTISLGSDLNADRQALSHICSSDYDGTITMRTPRGGEFAMMLPDSTQVWLNAESTISYPATFDSQLRKVSISGEAYFKVKHNAQQPFEVETNGQTVRVLGTEFQINAYDKSHIKTTLFKGSVAVSATGSKQGFVLTPGQTSDFNASTAKFSNIDADTVAVKSWLHGRFVFENQSLGNIMKELSRWYDFDYSFKDRSLASTVFMGSVPRYGDFREVLNILEKSGGLKFRQEGRKVIIEK